MLSISLMTSALALGLIASPHCASMCGCGLARPWLAQPVAFHWARGCAYVAAGSVAGALSAQIAVFAAQSAPMLQAFNAMLMAVLFFSALLLVWRGRSLTALVTQQVVRVPFLMRNSSGSVLVAGSKSPQQQVVGKRRAFQVGLMWPLLPCGVLWAALMLAYLSGSALQGGVVMLLFALVSTVAVQASSRLQQQLKNRVSEATVNRGCGALILTGLGLMLVRQLGWLPTPAFMQGLPLCW